MIRDRGVKPYGEKGGGGGCDTGAGAGTEVRADIRSADWSQPLSIVSRRGPFSRDRTAGEGRRRGRGRGGAGRGGPGRDGMGWAGA